MRSRAPAFIINTKTKRNIVTETNTSISGHQDESTLNMFNKINEKNIFPCPILNEGSAPIINLPVPEFQRHRIHDPRVWSSVPILQT